MIRTQSETIGKLAEALGKAQSEFAPIIKSSQAHRHKYADLGECFNSTRMALLNNGLAVAQYMSLNDCNEPAFVTSLLHSSGEFISGSMNFSMVPYGPAVAGSTALHLWGGTVTYIRRYMYCAMLGIIGEDEDQDGHHNRDSHQADSAVVDHNVVTLPELKVKLAGLIRENGCDAREFVKFHNISVDNSSLVLESILNFRNLLEIFNTSKKEKVVVDVSGETVA